MKRKIQFKIKGIHCKSCKSLIESEISLLKGIIEINVSGKENLCKINYDPAEISSKEIKGAIESLNYEAGPLISSSRIEENEKPFILKKIVALAIFLLIFSIIYHFVSSFGFFEILSKLNEKNLSLYLIFFIGLLASFHCMGMCGGMVIAYSSRYCGNKSRKELIYPHLMYNFGRLISYSLTGVILGSLGSFFAISRSFNGTATFLAGLFMVVVGVTLIGKISILEKISNILPSFIGKWIFSLTQGKTPKMPFIIGFFNGFMPCGPLQAIQIYALTSGSGVSGGLSMAFYALGTIPLMFLFGNFISFLNREKIIMVMKASGLVVILLGVLTINRGLLNLNSKDQSKINAPKLENSNADITENQNFQVIRMDLLYSGYSPNVLKVKKGIPVRFIINAKEISGCTKEILIPEFNIRKTLLPGENVIEFTPQRVGEIKFSCGMRMVWGKFVVD